MDGGAQRGRKNAFDLSAYVSSEDPTHIAQQKIGLRDQWIIVWSVAVYLVAIRLSMHRCSAANDGPGHDSGAVRIFKVC